MDQEMILQEEEQKVGLRYLVIQAEAILNPELSHTEKFVFGLVELLDGKNHCFATNEYMADIIKTSAQTISNSINKLIRLDYVKRLSFDGRKRIIAVNIDYREKYRHLLKSRDRSYNSSYSQSINEHIIDKDKINMKRKKITSTKVEVIGELSSPQQQPSSIEREKINIPSSDDRMNGAVQILEYWNSKGKPLTRHRLKSKVAKAALAAVAKRLNNGSNEQQITNAIDRYYTVLTSPYTDLNPTFTGHAVSLKEFFGFNSYTKSVMAKQKKPLRIKSWFDECISEMDLIEKFGKPLRKDNHPEITEKLKKRYGKRFLGTGDPEFSTGQLNNFILCSEKLMAYRQKLKKEYNGAVITINDLIDYVLESLEAKFGENGVTTGNLKSDYTWNELVPQYANAAGAFDWLRSGSDFGR